MTDRAPRPPTQKEVARLADRLALRPIEAAQVLGVSETRMRQLLPRIPHFHTEPGGRGCVLIPVEGLRRWVEAEAEAERSRVDRITTEIARSFSK